MSVVESQIKDNQYKFLGKFFQMFMKFFQQQIFQKLEVYRQPKAVKKNYKQWWKTTETGPNTVLEKLETPRKNI